VYLSENLMKHVSIMCVAKYIVLNITAYVTITTGLKVFNNFTEIE
jgi:hypothetical protein